jgi:hypothetical protein
MNFTVRLPAEFSLKTTEHNYDVILTVMDALERISR